MATAKQLDDIRECTICTEVYTDPRVLPCIHTHVLSQVYRDMEQRQTTWR